MANKGFSREVEDAIASVIPEDRVPVEAATLTIADLVAALKASSGNDDASMRKRAKFEAEARAVLDHVENTRSHPGISVYSHPEGDRAHPKDPLKCRMYWIGREEDLEVLTPQEAALMNLAQPGSYRFTRPDGTKDTLDVEPRYDLDGTLGALNFMFPCKDEKKHNVPSKVAMLREVFGAGETDDMAALRAELARTQALLVEAGRV